MHLFYKKKFTLGHYFQKLIFTHAYMRKKDIIFILQDKFYSKKCTSMLLKCTVLSNIFFNPVKKLGKMKKKGILFFRNVTLFLNFNYKLHIYTPQKKKSNLTLNFPNQNFRTGKFSVKNDFFL